MQDWAEGRSVHPKGCRGLGLGVNRRCHGIGLDGVVGVVETSVSSDPQGCRV